MDQSWSTRCARRDVYALLTVVVGTVFATPLFAEDGDFSRFGGWGGNMGGADPFAGIESAPADQDDETQDLPALDPVPTAYATLDSGNSDSSDEWSAAPKRQKKNKATLSGPMESEDGLYIFVLVNGVLVAVPK